MRLHKPSLFFYCFSYLLVSAEVNCSHSMMPPSILIASIPFCLRRFVAVILLFPLRQYIRYWVSLSNTLICLPSWSRGMCSESGIYSAFLSGRVRTSISLNRGLATFLAMSLRAYLAGIDINKYFNKTSKKRARP